MIGALETKANKKDYISKSEVGPVFEACSMEFNEKQVEYIVFYMFGHSESLNQLKYRNINKIGIDLLNYKNWNIDTFFYYFYSVCIFLI